MAKSDIFTVRKANESDLPYIAESENKIFSRPFSEEQILTDFMSATHSVLICENGTERAGYAVFSTVSDESELIRIAVGEKFRRRGLGEKMISFFLSDETNRELSVCFLEVRESNHAARNLYKKLGFTEIYVRKGYYSRPKEDGIVYRKELK